MIGLISALKSTAAVADMGRNKINALQQDQRDAERETRKGMTDRNIEGGEIANMHHFDFTQ
jgi:hypothetical protein